MFRISRAPREHDRSDSEWSDPWRVLAVLFVSAAPTWRSLAPGSAV